MKSHVDKIILGTAQLGLDYGINNSTGRPSEKVALDILEEAYRLGIRRIDTAKSYGSSHSLISKICKKYPDFKVGTKVTFDDGIDLPDQVQDILNELGCDQLDYLLLHDPAQISKFNQNPSIQIKKKLVVRIGVSVYENHQILEVLDYPQFKIVQLPFSILDNWNRRGKFIDLCATKEVKIHVRSVFLQGLFMMEEERIPNKLKVFIPFLKEIKKLALDFNYTLKEICLNYPLSFKEIEGIVIGVESIKQLEENLNSLRGQLPKGLLDEIHKIKIANEDLLNPSNWGK